MTKYVAPNVYETAFNCPHCGALTSQDWQNVFAFETKDNYTPDIWHRGSQRLKDVIAALSSTEDEKAKNEKHIKTLKRASMKLPFLCKEHPGYSNTQIYNLNMSVCYNCSQITLWIYDKMIWPSPKDGPSPNDDLPEDIKLDFEEASKILSESPRGAAALLRLCIQKLCNHLGEKGSIDECIANLVSKGLDKRIEKSLDIVRVIGNNAVHPGKMDLKDDHSTALKLFDLVNIITDALISQPKHIEELYSSLPQGAKDSIEKRNSKKLAKTE